MSHWKKNSRLLFWDLCCPHSLCNWDYRYAACFELKPPQESGDFCFQKQGQTIKDILRSNGFLPYCIHWKWLGASMVLWMCSNILSEKPFWIFLSFPFGPSGVKDKKNVLLDLLLFCCFGGFEFWFFSLCLSYDADFCCDMCVPWSGNLVISHVMATWFFSHTIHSSVTQDNLFLLLFYWGGRSNFCAICQVPLIRYIPRLIWKL